MSQKVIGVHRQAPLVVESSATRAECYVCGRGLGEVDRITAKTFPQGTVLFCGRHYSMQ